MGKIKLTIGDLEREGEIDSVTILREGYMKLGIKIDDISLENIYMLGEDKYTCYLESPHPTYLEITVKPKESKAINKIINEFINEEEEK